MEKLKKKRPDYNKLHEDKDWIINIEPADDDYHDKELDHELVADLVYFDGPFISLFESPDGDFYLYCWLDVDSSHNRWVIARLDRIMIRRYLSGEITLRDILTKPPDGFLYLIDMDENAEYDSVYVADPKDLPSAYLPGVNSYYTSKKFHRLTSDARARVSERVSINKEDVNQRSRHERKGRDSEDSRKEPVGIYAIKL